MHANDQLFGRYSCVLKSETPLLIFLSSLSLESNHAWRKKKSIVSFSLSMRYRIHSFGKRKRNSSSRICVLDQERREEKRETCFFFSSSFLFSLIHFRVDTLVDRWFDLLFPCCCFFILFNIIQLDWISSFHLEKWEKFVFDTLKKMARQHRLLFDVV